MRMSKGRGEEGEKQRGDEVEMVLVVGASVLWCDGIRCVLCSAHLYHHLLHGDINEKLLSGDFPGSRCL